MPRKKEIEIVLDTETTGLDYTRERIIEFAAVRLENGKIKDEFQTLINPHQHIRKSSIAVHGITQDMVEDAPSEEEALQMSRTLTELSGDISSFYNISQDEALTKLKSVFTGETETMKDLGIILNQDAIQAWMLANGMQGTFSAMSASEQVAIRYKYVLDQLKFASGDFAKT